MNQQLDLARGEPALGAPTHDDDLAPGRRSRSAGLAAPAHPITGGLIQRKARDANGIADGADQAIADASSSSGAALPDTVMRKFESSLATDLSSVRVHTGASSAAAADAVGARAYTLGSDIHFAAGQYDPSSTAGQHLLAHEVAHTVQQRGGSPTRQNKLEVSTPFDAAEHDADRAADAMASGKPAAIAPTRANVARLVVNALDRAGDQAAQQQAASQAAHPDVIAQLTVASDEASANQMLKMIHGWDGDMQAALLTKDATADDVLQNNVAAQKLEEYLGALRGESTGLGNFQVLYKRVQVDFARLQAMAEHAGSSITDKMNDASTATAGTGTSLANDHIDSAAGTNGGASALAAKAAKLAATDPELNAALQNLQEDTAPLAAQTQAVIDAEHMTTSSLTAIMAASDGITAIGARIKSATLKAQFDAAKKKIDENKQTVSSVFQLIATAYQAVAEPEDAVVTITSQMTSSLGPLAFNATFDLELTPEQERDSQNADVQADLANVVSLNGAKDAYVSAIADVKNKMMASSPLSTRSRR